jgi:hypothetical protein
VQNGARYHAEKGWWVLELSRLLETGHEDDLPLGDPMHAAWFSVAIHDDAAGADHAISPPIALRFVTAQ